MRVCNRRTCPIGIKSIAVDRPSTTRTHRPWHAFQPRATLSWRKMGCHSSQKCWEDNRILGNSASQLFININLPSTYHQPTINLPSTPHDRSTGAPPGLYRGSSGPVAPHRPLSRLAAPGSSAPELPRPHLSRHLWIGNLWMDRMVIGICRISPSCGWQLWMAGWLILGSMEWDTVHACYRILTRSPRPTFGMQVM